MPGAGHTPGPCEAGSVTPQAAQLQRPESLRQDQPALQCHTPEPTPADLGLAAGCGADADSLLQRLLVLAGLGIFRETAPRPETEAVLSAFDFGGMAGWWRWAAAGGGTSSPPHPRRVRPAAGAFSGRDRTPPLRR
jgi:hypothetical protein